MVQTSLDNYFQSLSGQCGNCGHVPIRKCVQTSDTYCIVLATLSRLRQHAAMPTINALHAELKVIGVQILPAAAMQAQPFHHLCAALTNLISTKVSARIT